MVHEGFAHAITIAAYNYICMVSDRACSVKRGTKNLLFFLDGQ